MKPTEENNKEETEITAALKGDAIGNTAYSERFALKILMKLANTETLEEEYKEQSFEDDLCTLWDMSSEKDVVLFLIKHDIINLYCFAIPIISHSRRVLELLIGILGNMCCHKEGKDAFLQKEHLMSLAFQYLRCDDSRVLIQLLRLISSCMSLADEDELEMWLNIFDNIDYAHSLYFMMKNSRNKELLITALETFNSLCSYCNVEKFSYMFFCQFVTKEALNAVTTAFNEIIVVQKDAIKKDEMERILVICLQLAMNLVDFDKSPEIYSATHKKKVVSMINHILVYYETKIADQKELDDELVDIMKSTNTVINMLEMGELAAPDQFFMPSYSIWRILVTARKEIENPSPIPTILPEPLPPSSPPTSPPPSPPPPPERDALDKTNEEVKDLAKRLIPQLGSLMCLYMVRCSDDNLKKVLNHIGDDFDEIVRETKEKELQEQVTERVKKFKKHDESKTGTLED